MRIRNTNLKIRVEIENILYPSDKNKVCIYSDDKEKMKLLNETLKITEKTLKDKHKAEMKAFMEDKLFQCMKNYRNA